MLLISNNTIVRIVMKRLEIEKSITYILFVNQSQENAKSFWCLNSAFVTQISNNNAVSSFHTLQSVLKKHVCD